MKNGRPKFAYNWLGREAYEVTSPKPLPAGAVTLRWEFIYDGGKKPGAGGRGDIFINGEQVASGRIDRTIPFFIGTEPADVGMDDLTPVTDDYKAYDNKFTGTIRKIVIGVGPAAKHSIHPSNGMVWVRPETGLISARQVPLSAGYG